MRPFPDFIIAGSAKSGTTALHYMLEQHPDVRMSEIKETNFFVHAFEAADRYVDHRGRPTPPADERRAIVDSLEKYRSMFAGARESQKLGEASPWYLINHAVPARIHGHRPDTRIVVILRNPADVAFANFMHHVRAGSESIAAADVGRILDARRYADERLYPFCRHLDIPRYAAHLPHWFDTFDRSQLHLMIYEEFRADRRRALSGLFAFLGLRDNVPIDVERRVNVSGVPRSRLVRDLIQDNHAFKRLVAAVVPTRPRRRIRALLETLNTNPRVTLPGSVRARLDDLYEADVAYVEAVLGRPVEHWRRLRVPAGSVPARLRPLAEA